MKNKIFDYHIHDSRQIEKVIKKSIVDVIITSPPYWNLKDYGINNQIGFGQKYEEYLEQLTEIFDKCKNVLKDTGSMWVIVDSFKKSGNVRMLPFEIADRLQKKGWHLQDIIIWRKDKTLPWSSKGKLRNIFEYVLFFTKSNNFNFYIDELREIELKKWWPKYPERYNPKGKVPSRVWEIPIPIQGWGKTWVRHFCPFPPKLVENILLLTTKENNVVLDPFAGSGSVLAQSKVMKRKFIGFDLNEDYKKMFKKDVVPFFDNMWKERKKELKSIKNKRSSLEKTIKQLRQLKFPALMIKESMKRQNYKSVPENLKAIIVLEQQNVPTINPKYFFIYGQNKNFDGLQKKINELKKIKPLKKFSINPNFVICNTHTIKENLKEIGQLSNIWIYKKGITNYYQDSKILIDFLENIISNNNTFPEIASNIKIKQRDHIIQ
tara:strand:+ start:235 stop:1539 length:1305 start_codon:yes stop_codon:yes gene_type:complete